MNNILKIVFFIILSFSFSEANDKGKKVFEAYCWGCHHQTSVAFGPSFQEIANKRTRGEIQGHIVSPKSTYKQLGHKRSVMPAFGDKLTQEEIDLVTNFIYSFKSKKD